MSVTEKNIHEIILYTRKYRCEPKRIEHVPKLLCSKATSNYVSWNNKLKRTKDSQKNLFFIHLHFLQKYVCLWIDYGMYKLTSIRWRTFFNDTPWRKSVKEIKPRNNSILFAGPNLGTSWIYVFVSMTFQTKSLRSSNYSCENP